MPISVAEPIDRRLARLQRAMGLTADGILGPETMTALEARILSRRQLAKVPCSLEVSRAGLDLLVAFEVSSPAYYEKKLRRPVWPGGESGVTIGIGYDVGVTGARQIDQDWRWQLSDAAVDRLLTAQCIAGVRATLEVYPRVDKLPPDAQAMVLSLIYNRGTRLTGSRRQHMAALKPLIARGDLDAMAGQFELMTQLWPDLPGLQTRRRKEAAMIRGADRRYSEDEIVRVRAGSTVADHDAVAVRIGSPRLSQNSGG